MKKLSRTVLDFFHNQGCVIVSTFDADKGIHAACKGVVEIDAQGHVYLFDLYRGVTYDNLKKNDHISISAVDEHRFLGYCLKGKARVIGLDKVNAHILRLWEDRISQRLTRRVIRNLREDKGHPSHPEAMLPRPEYLIVMDVREVIDLRPAHLQKTRE